MCEQCRRRAERLEADVQMVMLTIMTGQNVTISFPDRERAEAIYAEATRRMDSLLRKRL